MELQIEGTNKCTGATHGTANGPVPAAGCDNSVFMVVWDYAGVYDFSGTLLRTKRYGEHVWGPTGNTSYWTTVWTEYGNLALMRDESLTYLGCA